MIKNPDKDLSLKDATHPGSTWDQGGLFLFRNFPESEPHTLLVVLVFPGFLLGFAEPGSCPLAPAPAFNPGSVVLGVHWALPTWVLPVQSRAQVVPRRSGACAHPGFKAAPRLPPLIGVLAPPRVYFPPALAKTYGSLA